MRAERTESIKVKPGVVRAPRRAPGWVVPLAKAALGWTGGALAAACFGAAYVLREGGSLLTGFSFARGFVWEPHFEPYAALLWFVVLVRLVSNVYYDLYRLRGEFLYLDECVRVVRAAAVGSLLIVAWAFLYRGGFEFRAFSYARGVFVLDFVLALAAYTLVRLAARGVQSAVRRREINLIPTLVVGGGAQAALCARAGSWAT